MADIDKPRRAKIPTKEFLADLRSPLTDRELRAKYGLSARNFVNLVKALVARNLVSQQDLALRRQKSEQRDLAKESEFLSQLYICPNCSHPSPHPFETCPACGASAEEVGEATRPFDFVTSSGEHFFLEEAPQAVTQEVEILNEEDVIEEVPEVEEEEKEPPQEKEPPGRESSAGPLRSWLAKLRPHS